MSNKDTYVIQIVTEEENNALLAAIRCYQSVLDGVDPRKAVEDVEEIATNGMAHPAPTAETFNNILRQMGCNYDDVPATAHACHLHGGVSGVPCPDDPNMSAALNDFAVAVLGDAKDAIPVRRMQGRKADSRPVVHADDSIDMDDALRTLAAARAEFDKLLRGGGWPNYKEDQHAFFVAWLKVWNAAGELWIEGPR